jgi:hypothetical protein
MLTLAPSGAVSQGERGERYRVTTRADPAAGDGSLWRPGPLTTAGYLDFHPLRWGPVDEGLVSSRYRRLDSTWWA